MNSLVASFNISEPQVGLMLPNPFLTEETEDILPDFNSLWLPNRNWLIPVYFQF